MIVRNETLDPSTLSANETESLISSLYTVHSEIFDGVSRDQFAKYVVCSPAKRTRIQLSLMDTMASWPAIWRYMHFVRCCPEECTVLRAEAGLRRRIAAILRRQVSRSRICSRPSGTLADRSITWLSGSSIELHHLCQQRACRGQQRRV